MMTNAILAKYAMNIDILGTNRGQPDLATVTSSDSGDIADPLCSAVSGENRFRTLASAEYMGAHTVVVRCQSPLAKDLFGVIMQAKDYCRKIQDRRKIL